MSTYAWMFKAEDGTLDGHAYGRKPLLVMPGHTLVRVRITEVRKKASRKK